jgi:hypothetical protein
MAASETATVVSLRSRDRLRISDAEFKARLRASRARDEERVKRLKKYARKAGQ